MTASLLEWAPWLIWTPEKAGWKALEPALELLSALGSSAASVFYVRAMGAAAFWLVRDADRGVIRGYRLDERWVSMLLLFVSALLLAAALQFALERLMPPALWPLPSEHAMFTAVLVGTLWARASDRGARLALLVFLFLVAGSRMMLGADSPAGVIAGVVVGMLCVLGVRWLARAGQSQPGPPRETALDILRKWYAKGKIGCEESEEKTRDIET